MNNPPTPDSDVEATGLEKRVSQWLDKHMPGQKYSAVPSAVESYKDGYTQGRADEREQWKNDKADIQSDWDQLNRLYNSEISRSAELVSVIAKIKATVDVLPCDINWNAIKEWADEAIARYRGDDE